MSKVRLAIVGVGNCASSLVQGLEYYKDADPDERVPGLMHVELGGYHIRDIEVVAAFDVDAKKVGRDVSEAIYTEPNNTIRFADVAPTMRIAQEEIFGPVVSVMPCRSFEQAIDIGNDVEYGLSASIYTQDVNRAFAAMRDLYTGIFYVNAPTIGAEVHLPFGGTKNTGNGHREAGTAALDVFSEWKSIYVDFSGKLQRAQIDVSEI